MTYEFDEGRGQAIGSNIKRGGSAFGLDLSIDEVIIERDPPRRKVWRTVGHPRLLVVGAYEMGSSSRRHPQVRIFGCGSPTT